MDANRSFALPNLESPQPTNAEIANLLAGFERMTITLNGHWVTPEHLAECPDCLRIFRQV